MDADIIARATWHQNANDTLILKCCLKDGGAVIGAVIGAGLMAVLNRGTATGARRR